MWCRKVEELEFARVPIMTSIHLDVDLIVARIHMQFLEWLMARMNYEDEGLPARLKGGFHLASDLGRCGVGFFVIVDGTLRQIVAEIWQSRGVVNKAIVEFLHLSE